MRWPIRPLRDEKMQYPAWRSFQFQFIEDSYTTCYPIQYEFNLQAFIKSIKVLATFSGKPKCKRQSVIL